MNRAISPYEQETIRLEVAIAILMEMRSSMETVGERRIQHNFLMSKWSQLCCGLMERLDQRCVEIEASEVNDENAGLHREGVVLRHRLSEVYRTVVYLNRFIVLAVIPPQH